jgi:hypothetical protein
MAEGILISNLFGLHQTKPWQVWRYRLKDKETAVDRNRKSLLNSACFRLTNKFRHPFFYEEETIISLVDIGASFETEDYILEQQSFIFGYFLSGQDAWNTFINSFENLLMKDQRNGNVVENPPKGCVISLSKQEAIVSTYKLSRGTHIPLRIKVLHDGHGAYPLNEAIEDVLRLTLLNFSSFTLNKLPATVAFADRIAWFNLHNISPDDRDGNLFFL